MVPGAVPAFFFSLQLVKPLLSLIVPKIRSVVTLYTHYVPNIFLLHQISNVSSVSFHHVQISHPYNAAFQNSKTIISTENQIFFKTNFSFCKKLFLLGSVSSLCRVYCRSSPLSLSTSLIVISLNFNIWRITNSVSPFHNICFYRLFSTRIVLLITSLTIKRQSQFYLR